MFDQLFGSGRRSRLVDAAMNDVSQMLRLSGEMLDLALDGLLANREIDADLDRMDDDVDASERMVRRTVLEHLAVNPKSDLVTSLLLVSIVQDAERVGDFARGLLEVAKMTEHPRQGEYADRLGAMARRVRPLLEVTERAFREDDAERATEVIQTHRELREELKRYRMDVAHSDLPADLAVVYASAAQILRRIGAHLSNICSAVVQPFDRIRHGDEDV